MLWCVLHFLQLDAKLCVFLSLCLYLSLCLSLSLSLYFFLSLSLSLSLFLSLTLSLSLSLYRVTEPAGQQIQNTSYLNSIFLLFNLFYPPFCLLHYFSGDHSVSDNLTCKDYHFLRAIIIRPDKKCSFLGFDRWSPPLFSHVCSMIFCGKVMCIGLLSQISGFMCNNKSIEDQIRLTIYPNR